MPRKDPQLAADLEREAEALSSRRAFALTFVRQRGARRAQALEVAS